MFREKEICNAIRTAYLHLFPDKKERKRALSRLDLELVAQGVRYRGESVLAYSIADERAKKEAPTEFHFKDNANIRYRMANLRSAVNKYFEFCKENND